MTKGKFFFTSESVGEGHPDKVCDQISDAVLDTIMAKDPKCRVGCEVMAGPGFVHLAGEVTTDTIVNYDEVARNVMSDIGYTDPSIGFDAKKATIEVSIGRQSPDISQGVTEGEGLYKEQGAGDQGMMFGYACNENDEYMPSPIYYAHAMMVKLAEARRSGALTWLRPDGKGQITVEYDNWKPVRIDTVVLSSQHAPEVTHEQIQEGLMREVVQKALPKEMLDSKTKYLINPTGRFVVGGPQGDCGLTGRKIIVDTYGGWGRHGGGAFSGKDPSKVDRSASYMARYIAKNIVAAELAQRCEVQLAYAIGVAEPVSVMVDSFGTGKISSEKLSAMVQELFPLKPKGIIDKLQLLRPIYQKTAAHGHFGRGKDGFSWEATDMVSALKKAAG